MLGKLMQWGYDKGLKEIEKQVVKAIKEGRLVFSSATHVSYINKQGEIAKYDLEQMAKVAVEVGGWQDTMEKLGITNQDVVDILIKERAKQKKEDE